MVDLVLLEYCHNGESGNIQREGNALFSYMISLVRRASPIELQNSHF